MEITLSDHSPDKHKDSILSESNVEPTLLKKPNQN